MIATPPKRTLPATLTKRGRSAGVPRRLRRLRPLRVKSIRPWTSPRGPVRGGTTYASNLTPDTTTGLQARRYSEASFVAMFRTGKKPNGVGILPPMPYEMYANMTDDDLKAVWAYLQTIKPVRKQVPANVPAPVSTAATSGKK